jgi:fatty acid desaturase
VDRADAAPTDPRPRRDKLQGGTIMTLATVLWIVAVILVIAGIFAIIRKQVIWGVVLIVVGLLVGPGGVSIFT